MSSVLAQKLDRSFAQMDVNGNGRIERDDVLALGARVLVGFGESPTSLKGKALLDRYERIWDQLVAELDGDGDGVLSADEFRSAMTSAFVTGPKFDTVFRPAAEAVAALTDTDGDGHVGQTEFTVLQRAFGTSVQDAAVAFARMDTSGDGRLSVTELVEATREYYTSEDPEAAGNWLFGPLGA